MCRTCMHKAVCSKFAATGGHVRECEHFREDRKGVWVDRYGGKYANPRYDCSKCKTPSLYKIEIDVLGNDKILQAPTNFCPNCGADMRGAEDGK